MMSRLANIRQLLGGNFLCMDPLIMSQLGDLVDGCGARRSPHQIISAHPLLNLFKGISYRGDELQMLESEIHTFSSFAC